ncbi:hypothetical protein SISSUDRAFT_1062481 [Sistotremastrum suecicum HHB10207 ss-3]|uniref:3'-5' exonuclease domain-containing protein n=1 Tax=Sistotremastrum suecicum HHB10207 ss-3 TaxID=1314776 RepID=A0A166CWX0_9AGAM|nr:hypothetical protein SISSUDRAFT_1062481 [Sistotremastrum suecicum HHB10207 ss-3]
MNRFTTPVEPGALPWFSYKEYFPNARFEYLKTELETNAFMSQWKPEIVGMKVEWTPRRNEAPNAAVLQFANEEYVVVIDLRAMWTESERDERGYVSYSTAKPIELSRFLEDTSILKVGLDHAKLLSIDGTYVKTCRDLSVMAKLVDPQWSHLRARQALTWDELGPTYLDVRLPRDNRGYTDWEEDNLYEKDLEYLGNGAAIAFAVYECLEPILDAMEEPPKGGRFTFSIVRGNYVPCPNIGTRARD